VNVAALKPTITAAIALAPRLFTTTTLEINQMKNRRFVAFNEDGRVWEGESSDNPFELDLSKLREKGAQSVTLYMNNVEVATIYLNY